MTARLAEHSGFCFGVRRAIQMAIDAKREDGDVCTLGELIHNPEIVRDLARQGIEPCADAQAIHGKTVIIRSHGAARHELDQLQQAGNRIVDATCPYVKRAQELVAGSCANPVFIMGDAAHPEVRGMLSYGNERTQVVDPDTPLADQNWKILSVVCQTTKKAEDLQKLVCRLLPNTLELHVYNTICSATSQRQAASVALAKDSELMVVIGGKNSSNTRALHQLCAGQTRSVHIETEEELTPELLAGARRIGLAAGASTPDSTIVRVWNKIKEMNGEPGTARSSREIPLYKEESC